MPFTRGVLCLMAVWLGGCGAPPPAPAPAGPPFTPVADVKLLMQTVVDPATDVIWDSVKTVDSAAGVVEYAPDTDEEWAAVRNSAFVVAESGNLLMVPGRSRDDDEWMRLSRALVEVGKKTIAAADAKNKDALFDAGGELYVACVNCHDKYIVDQPKPLP